jgi:HD superfamily phosphohydrolase YqeK
MKYDFEQISGIVKGFVDEKRFSHTLYVTKEAYALGKLFLPEKAEKLAIAALLHDITKNFSFSK